MINVKYDYDFARDKTGKVLALEYAPNKIMTTRKTVCEGFANLLQQLCDLSGIKSETVVGYAKGGNYFIDGNIITQSNHKWNVIFYENHAMVSKFCPEKNILETYYPNGLLKSYKTEFRFQENIYTFDQNCNWITNTVALDGKPSVKYIRKIDYFE